MTAAPVSPSAAPAADVSNSPLGRFYAVTVTSLYLVEAAPSPGGQPYIEKLASNGGSSVSVGRKLTGSMLAIARKLQFYTPDGHRFLSATTSYERQLERVNTEHFGPHSSPIVALFLDEDEARECFAARSTQHCDMRWILKTMAVLEAVGYSHPTITICRFPGLGLELPSLMLD